MLLAFFVSMFLLIYIYFGYPIMLMILSTIFRKTVDKKDITPSISLIISVYNEENIIRQKMENSLSLDYPSNNLQIIVASESTDKTNVIVREYEEKNIILCAFDKREGKRATLYRTVPLAKGEIIVFSDANALYEKDALKKIARNFHDPRIGCVSGRLKYVNPKKTAIGMSEKAYWEFDIYLKKLASKMLALGGGVNGSIFAIRKELYNPIDKYRGDDFEISCRIEIAGHGVILEPEAISYEESSENSRQELRRKIRLATWNIKSALILLREACNKKRFLTAFILISHRLLRYSSPLWLIGLFISNMFLSNDPFQYFLFLQSAFYLFAVLGWAFEKKEIRANIIFRIPFYFCLMNYAGFLSIFKLITGRTEMLWEKVR